MSLISSTEATEKDLVVYHKNCVDGFSAAWVFWNLQQESKGSENEREFEFLAATYADAPPNIENRTIYCVDFCYSTQNTLKLAGNGNTVIIIDHHKSSVSDTMRIMGHEETPLPISPTTYVLKDALDHTEILLFASMEMSGATLAWEYIYGPDSRRPLLLSHVEDRDLWRFRYQQTKEISVSLAIRDKRFEVWDGLMKDPYSCLELFKEGAYLVKKQEKDVREIAQYRRMFRIGGHEVITVNAPFQFASDVGSYLSPGQPFVATYQDTEESRVFSLRSAPDGLDVSQIASIYGGGGHKHASGFRVPRFHELAMK